MADDFDPYYTWLGIPPEEQPPDHYRLLGVRRYEGNADVITNAMDQRMHYLRSLQVGKRSALSQKILNEVSAAGVVLLDGKRRTEYDQQLRAQEAARQPVLPPQAVAAATTAAPPVPKAPRPLPVAAPLTPAAPVVVHNPAAGVQLSPAASAAAKMRRDKGSLLQSPMVIGGAAFAGVAVLGLIGMLVVMSRQKPPSPDPDKVTAEIAGNGKGKDKSEDGKGQSGNGTATVNANGKLGQGKTTTNVAESPRTNVRPWWNEDVAKRQLFALQLEGQDEAALNNTAALVALDKPFTVEAWIKIDFGQNGTTQIFGTSDGMVRGALPGGWRLLARRHINGGQRFDQWILEGWAADTKLRTPIAMDINGGIPAGHWMHVAVVHNAPAGTEVFLDGRSRVRIDSRLMPRETDLVLGATRGSAPQAGIRTQLCGLRISDMARYSGPFSPPSPLEMEHDNQTAAALNFVMPMHEAAAGTVRRGDAPWQYGYGQFDEGARRVTKFAQFTEFNGVQWKSEKSIPGGHGQWVSLDPLGGHTGSQPDLSVIRRWTAPQNGILAISGKLTHVHEDRFGDGVRGRIVSSASGSAGQWDSLLNTALTNVEKLDVKRGDTVDFVVECKDNNHCDKFAWPVELRLTGSDGKMLGQWSSQADFQGPRRAGAVAAMASLGGIEWRTLDGQGGVKGLRLAEVPDAAAAGDLIAASANTRRLLRGTLTKQGDFLRVGPAPTAVVLPVGLPEQYDLEAEVVRESGDESICLGIPVPGNRRLTAIVDGMAGTRTGLASVNKQQLFTAGNPLVHQGRLLTNGQSAVIRLEVRGTGVKLLVDGKLITHWQNNPSDELNHAKGMGGFNDKGALGILTWNAPYLVKRLAMTPHTGGDPPSPSPSSGPRIELVKKHATGLAPERGQVDYSDAGGWLLGGPVTSFTIPEAVPDEYVIEAEITREEGTDAIGFNLPVRGSSLTALIDGYNSRLTGLSNIGGATIQSPENKTVHRGAVLTIGEPVEVRITVNRREIALAIDGETISRWDYDPDATLEPFTGARTRNPERIGVTAWNSKYRIRRLDLLPAAASKTPLASGSVPLIDAEGRNLRAIAGKHEVSAGSLTTGPDRTKVVFAEELPDEYTLQAEVTRLEGDDTLGFGLWVQGRPLSILIDGWRSKVSGICLVPGQDDSSPRGSTMKAGPLLTTGKPAQLRIVVNRQHVQVEIDGSIIARWQNDPNAQLRAFGGYESPEPGKLAITSSEPRFRIADLTLLRAAASSPSPRPEPPPPLGTASKTPIPDAEALAAAKTQFTAVYGAQLKGAKAAAKLAVAKKIFEDARSTRDMPVRYYMLEECRKLFVESRDFASALDTADLTSQDFAADPLVLKLGVLEAATQGGALPPAQKALLVSEACGLGFEAIDGDRLDAAKSIAPVVRKLSARASDDVQAEAKEFLDEYALRQKRSDVVKRAEQELAAKPDDAGAHLTLGLYYYFDLGEPAKGLPHLEKGSDPKLAAAAREQQAARGMAGSLPEAKAWQAATAGAPAEYKLAIQQRALEAYEAAIPVVEGFERTQAIQARDQLKADLKGSATPASKRGPRIRKNDLPETSPGLVGSVTLPNGQSAGVFVTYQTGRSMDEEKLQAILRGAAAPGAVLQLEGILRCPVQMRVSIDHRGSSSGPKQRLWIDGNPLNEVGGNKSRSRFQEVELPAGEHRIQWAVEFDGRDGPLLHFFDRNDGRPLQIYFNRDRHYYYRRAAKSQVELSN